ncbi:MAG TPA: hypothetical protein VFC78_13265 [Tepidisphaeraceae bacterium]|nr:hypothetical protein [Tepidisphaeraceae bacterium]
MIKTLKKHGNEYALVIEKPLMDALGITPDMRLQVVVSGNRLIVTPLDVGIGREAVAASLRKLRPRYRGMLKRLAESLPSVFDAPRPLVSHQPRA